MDLTFEERVKACAIAAALVEREAEHYKPDKPAVRAEGASARVVEQTYRGFSGDELVVQSRLQWTASIASTQTSWRESVVLHTRYKIVQGTEGRRLKLVSLHVPAWEKNQEGDRHMCLTCGPDFTKHDVIVQDTSLHEF